MKTPDDVLKMKASALYIVQQLGGEVDYVKLFKLLYYAQERSLAFHAKVIFNDTFAARDRGPVPSFINASIKQLSSPIKGEELLDLFASGFEKGPDFKIKALEQPDMDELSGSDVECLNYVVDSMGHLSANELSSRSHQDGGWIRANDRRAIDPDQDRITRLEMAKAGGASQGMLNYIRAQIDLDKAMAR